MKEFVYEEKCFGKYGGIKKYVIDIVRINVNQEICLMSVILCIFIIFCSIVNVIMIFIYQYTRLIVIYCY